MKFLLDTNIFDAIVAEPGMTDTLKRLCENQSLQLLSTAIQEQELSQIHDAQKHAAIAEIPCKRVSVPGSVYGLGLKYGTGIKYGAVPRPTQSRDVNSHLDALIAAAAESEADVLVTNEKKGYNFKHVMRSRNSKCEVWNFEQFKTYISSIV